MTTLIGQKLGMTQMFAPDGATVPVTLIHVPQAFVTQIKTAEKDGYLAVQVGTRIQENQKRAEKLIAKPQLGHLKKAEKNARTVYEYRVESADEIKDLKVGQEISLDTLNEGDAVQIRGTSKGRGFAGVVKRHHFRGGPASHGHKDNLRMPGSIGAQQPQHVWPGTRMGGHMGAEKVFVNNVEIVKTDKEKRMIVIKGPVPGALHGWLSITVTGAKAKNPIKDRNSLMKSKGQGSDDKAKAKSESKDKKPAEKSAKKDNKKLEKK